MPVRRCSGPQALDYLGARGRLVAQHAASGAPAEFINDVCREAVREHRKRLFERQSGQLPVTGRGVLAGRYLGHAAVARAGVRCARAELCAGYIVQTQRAQRIQFDAAAFKRVFQRVRAGVAICGRIGLRAYADRVHYDQQHATVSSYTNHLLVSTRRHDAVCRRCAR